MATQKVLVLDTTTNEPKQVTPNTTSAGSGDAGKLVALNASGQIDATMLPEYLAETCTAGEAISAGAFVHVYNVAGTGEAQNALAADNTKPCVGWAPNAIGSASSGQINFGGVNAVAPLGSFAASNIGQEVFLDPVNKGLCVINTTAFTTGQLVQSLGVIIAVNVGASTMSVAFNPRIICVA